MSTVIRDFVEYHGLDRVADPSSIFKQITVDKRFCLPIEKPKLEQVVRVDVTSKVICSRRIKTPKGISSDGLRLTGQALVVCGELTVDVQYVALLKEQTVHTVLFSMPFSSVLILPKKCGLNYSNAVAKVEDISVTKIDDEWVYIAASLYIATSAGKAEKTMNIPQRAVENLPEQVQYFQLLSVTETLKIPSEKPDVEMITECMAQPKLESVKLVKTPEALSYEGQNLTGYKLVAEMRLPERIKYVADLPCQSVHVAHYDRCMKSVFVVVPEQIDGEDIEKIVSEGRYMVKAYVLNVCASRIDKRTFLKCVTVLLEVKFCK